MIHTDLEFEQIHADFRPKIQRYLIRLVGEPEAEDLTQEVFVKVSRALNNFRGESHSPRGSIALPPIPPSIGSIARPINAPFKPNWRRTPSATTKWRLKIKMCGRAKKHLGLRLR